MPKRYKQLQSYSLINEIINKCLIIAISGSLSLSSVPECMQIGTRKEKFFLNELFLTWLFLKQV